LELTGAALLDPIERRVERPLLDVQHLAGQLPDALNDAVPMERPYGQSLENEQVERPL